MVGTHRFHAALSFVIIHVKLTCNKQVLLFRRLEEGPETSTEW